MLHIGPPKTGTSALQASFHAAREELTRHGVRYVSRGANPLSAARFAAGTPVPDRPGAEERWRRISEEFRTSDARCTLLSSEGFSAAAPDRIAEIAEQLGPDVTVVVTLRPMADLLPSSWQQALRRGGVDPLESWLRDVLDPEHEHHELMQRYTPEAIVRNWGRCFGEDRLVFVCPDPDDRAHLHRVFESLLGIDGVLEPQAVRNASPPYAEVEMLRHFNLVHGRVGDDAEAWTRVIRRVGRRMGDAPPSGAGAQPARMSRRAARRVNEQMRASIAVLEESTATVVGDPDGLLVDPADYPERVDTPTEVGVSSAGWFADAVAQEAVAEFTGQAQRRIHRLEQRVARLADPNRHLDRAPVRDLLRALGRRARRGPTVR